MDLGNFTLPRIEHKQIQKSWHWYIENGIISHISHIVIFFFTVVWQVPQWSFAVSLPIVHLSYISKFNFEGNNKPGLHSIKCGQGSDLSKNKINELELLYERHLSNSEIYY